MLANRRQHSFQRQGFTFGLGVEQCSGIALARRAVGPYLERIAKNREGLFFPHQQKDDQGRCHGGKQERRFFLHFLCGCEAALSTAPLMPLLVVCPCVQITFI